MHRFMIDSHLKPQYNMIMSKLYDTGYNLTNLVEERRLKQKSVPKHLYFGSCLYELHHTVGKQNLVHPI